MLSIIIPFHNEKESLPILIKQLETELKNIKLNYELIFVDDGSNDNYSENIFNKKNIKLIKHYKKLGKGAGLKTCLENSSRDLIAFIDADLQDDPKDLKKFLEKINQSYDFINGYRKNRQDNFLVKIYSKLAQFFLKKFLKSPYSDINCGFKVFKRKVLKDFIFYGNNFRFFPLHVYYQGYKVGEVIVNNQPRKYGKTKFGKGKLIIGIFDTLTAYFLYKFSEKPLHFFGIIGGIFFILGFLISLYLAIERIFFNILLYRRPLLLFGILLIIVGIQIIMTGIIAELIVYINKKNKNLRS